MKREPTLTGFQGRAPFWTGATEDLWHPDDRAPEPRDPPCLQCQPHKTFMLFKEDGRGSCMAQEGFSSSTLHNNHSIARAFLGQQILQGQLTHWAHTCETKESSGITNLVLEDGVRGSSRASCWRQFFCHLTVLVSTLLSLTSTSWVSPEVGP